MSRPSLLTIILRSLRCLSLIMTMVVVFQVPCLFLIEVEVEVVVVVEVEVYNQYVTLTPPIKTTQPYRVGIALATQPFEFHRHVHARVCALHE
jgi:hypothetical protein